MMEFNPDSAKLNYKNSHHNVRILKFFQKKNNIKNQFTMFQNFYIKKNNNSLISNLLNSSKNLVKNNSNYKSYTDLPKSFQHYYPYKPTHNRCILSAKHSSYSKMSLISSYNTINGSKTAKKNNNSKIYLKENKYKLNLKQFNFMNYNVNETIFFDFIDGYNINSKLKEKYNSYILNHPLENDNDINIFQLFDMLQNFKIDYNDNNFFNENSTSKINKFKLKNNLLVKIKISSINIIFYKINPKKKNNINNKDYLFDNNNNSNNNNFKLKSKNKANTKIKLPFGFLAFFYGINHIELLKFLIAVIDYDYIKNIFFIDSKKFMRYYNLYKKDHSFFGETSYFQTYYNKNKEFLMYDWDVKNKNNIYHYIMKIVLPQIKININMENQTISKFYYSIDTNKMIYLLKEKFRLWDFHILKFFSQYKLFRKEINKIICNKLSYGIKFEDNKSSIDNNIDCNRDLNYTKRFNFNKMNTNFSALIQNENSFEFFFSQNINDKNEGYFFQVLIPKIHIIYQDINFYIDKFFDLDIKRMSQINKLRKSFQIEDIIKYSMVIVDEKYQVPNKKKSSFFENNGYRRSIKRSSTLKSLNNSQRLNLKAVSSRSSMHNSNNNFPSKFKIVRTNKKTPSTKRNNDFENLKKDIKLNLDKYIFNFDDDILKFIKPIEGKKNEGNSNLCENSVKSISLYNKRRENKEGSFRSNKTNKLNNGQPSNKEKLSVEIGTIKLIWTKNDLKMYDYLFEENESQYLLDNPPSVWENYIENNLNEYNLKCNLVDYSFHL